MHDLVRDRRGRRLGGSGSTAPRRPGTGRWAVSTARAQRPAVLLGILGATAVVVSVLTLWLTGGGPAPAAAGLPSAGELSGWGLPAFRVLGDLAAIGTVGALLVGAVLTPSGPGRLAGVCARAVTAASAWAAGWAAASALTVLFTVSDVEGVPVSHVLGADSAAVALSLPQTRALLLVTVAAAAVSVLCSRVSTVTGARWAAAAAVATLLPPLYTGHSAHTADHTLATGSLVVHVVAAVAWIGGLLGIVLHLRRPGAEQLRAVPRFSALALLCFCAVAGSGVVAALARLGLTLDTWLSAYGAVLAAKAVAVVGLGAFGWLHRTRTMAALRAGAPRAFWRLAAGELVLMAVVTGLAVALARTPAPTVTGDALLPTGIAWWQPDVVASVVVLGALATYLNGVRLANCLGFVRPGHPGWSRTRTGAAVLAAAVALVATGAPARPSSGDVVSVQVAGYLALAVVVPVLVALAAPGELDRVVRPGARAPEQAGRWVRLLRDPVNAFLLLVAVTAGVWATPLSGAATRSALLHLVVEGAALVAGTALFRSVLEASTVSGRMPVRDRVILLLVTGGFLVGFATALGTRTPVPGTTVAGAGVVSVGQVLSDQHRAATLLVAVAVALVALAAGEVLRAQRSRDRGKRNPAAA